MRGLEDEEGDQRKKEFKRQKYLKNFLAAGLEIGAFSFQMRLGREYRKGISYLFNKQAYLTIRDYRSQTRLLRLQTGVDLGKCRDMVDKIYLAKSPAEQ